MMITAIKRNCDVDCGRLDAQVLASSTCGAKTIWHLRQQL